jgi:hypothetical protein
MRGFEARSGELARRSAHDLPIDGIGLCYGNADSSSPVTGKPEVILEWCQQANTLTKKRPVRVGVDGPSLSPTSEKRKPDKPTSTRVQKVRCDGATAVGSAVMVD